jgi:hypothetical protein
VLVFGFTHTKNRFEHEVDQATVSFVTSSGAYLSGRVDQVALEHICTDHRQGAELREILTKLGSNVMADRMDALERDTTLGGTVIRLIINDVDIPAGFEDGGADAWRAAALTFARSYASGEGLDGDDEVFVRRCEWLAMQSDSREAELNRYPLPGGDGYYVVRFVDGVRTDVDVLRTARAHGMHTALKGPSGNGKTTLATVAHRELVEFACFEGMQDVHLVGSHQPVPNEPSNFRWVDGPLWTAMERDLPLVLDDFGWMPHGVQALLLPAMDGRRRITVSERPGQQTVTAGKGFVVIINFNPGLGFGISGPIHDRLSFEIEVPPDLRAAARLGVPPSFMAVATTLQNLAANEVENGIDRWVPSIRTLLEVKNICEAFDERMAASALIAQCPAGEQRKKLRDLLSTELNTTFEGDGTLRSRSI